MEIDLKEKLKEFVDNLGYYVWDIKYIDGKKSRLDVMIDGVTLYDCAELSRKIGTFIDENNLIRDSYLLTVSSPGVNRRLTKLEHYTKSIGKPAKIKTKEGIYKGIINRVDNDVIYLKTEDEVAINFSEIEKANLNII
jgi:ribosome maturation factor RimP